MSREVIVADYGSGNLFSIGQALTKCGAKPQITDDHSSIAGASHLVIPGVGAFGQCMSKIRNKGLIDPLKEAIDRGAWVLGICIGMQILFESSEEFGEHEGLGIIPGKVMPIPSVDPDGQTHKVPFVGWSALQVPPEIEWSGTILENAPASSPCYFVHSFMAEPKSEQHRLADTYYGQTRVCAATHSKNVFGTQFHPEKSGQMGLDILNGFLQL